MLDIDTLPTSLRGRRKQGSRPQRRGKNKKAGDFRLPLPYPLRGSIALLAAGNRVLDIDTLPTSLRGRRKQGSRPQRRGKNKKAGDFRLPLPYPLRGSIALLAAGNRVLDIDTLPTSLRGRRRLGSRPQGQKQKAEDFRLPLPYPLRGSNPGPQH